MPFRTPVFDAIRALRGDRSFSAMEVAQIDDVLDRLSVPREPQARLGALSERYESGGRGPGTVSSGKGDPGGVSYGLYQLASKTGTAGAFVKAEGAAWPALAKNTPGSAAFSTSWQDIAAREPDKFAAAQHAFIKRTHYRPVVDEVRKATGVDCDAQPQAVRDAVWSCSVQHGRAGLIVADGVRRADAKAFRQSPRYPRALVNGIYDAREAYVRGLAEKASGATLQTFRNILDDRYPDERRRALDMLA